MTVPRPVWRSFTRRFLDRAAAHVRSGGHALVIDSLATLRNAFALLPCDDGDMPELSYWSVLALGSRQFTVVSRGPARGLARVKFARELAPTARSWCERDSAWPDSVHVFEYDCEACAACCRHNDVLLTRDDLMRWHEAGRPNLAAARFVRIANRRAALRHRRNGDCVHLVDNLCGIYELRPDNCSAFPAGSESCLGARMVDYGWIDGLPRDAE